MDGMKTQYSASITEGESVLSAMALIEKNMESDKVVPPPRNSQYYRYLEIHDAVNGKIHRIIDILYDETTTQFIKLPQILGSRKMPYYSETGRMV